MSKDAMQSISAVPADVEALIHAVREQCLKFDDLRDPDIDEPKARSLITTFLAQRATAPAGECEALREALEYCRKVMVGTKNLCLDGLGKVTSVRSIADYSKALSELLTLAKDADEKAMQALASRPAPAPAASAPEMEEHMAGARLRQMRQAWKDKLAAKVID